MLLSLLKFLLKLPGQARRVQQAKIFFETGLAQEKSKDYSSARRSFERAIALDPENANAHRWLGRLLARDQSYNASAHHLERALTLKPDIPGAWTDLGSVYYLQGDLARAGASFRAELDHAPDSVLAHFTFGLVLKETGRVEEALAHQRRAYELAPEGEGTLRNLIVTLVEVDRLDEALSIAATAVERDPASYEAQFSLAFVRQKLHEPERAFACYDAALKIRAGDAEFYGNRGVLFQELGRLPEALEDYERALALQPDLTLAAFHRALARLLMGDYAGGWTDYELRQTSMDYPRRANPNAFPRWDGTPLAGRTILVDSEQGLGDEMMFASCLPQIIEAAGHCIIECDPKLEGLFRRSFPAATVYQAAPDRSVPPDIMARGIDVEIAAGSLPLFLRRGPGDFPRHKGYLRADPLRIAYWRERLAQLGPGIKVGISWQGGVRKTNQPLRSMALERWLPLLAVPDTRFVSLQYTSGASDEVAGMRARHEVNVVHWQQAIDDYEETAALICALDLMISVCTAAIHLGGALGRPVWVMAPYSPEWRYGFAGDAMPWYPSVRLFRQTALGEWGPVLARVTSELSRRAEAWSGQAP